MYENNNSYGWTEALKGLPIIGGPLVGPSEPASSQQHYAEVTDGAARFSIRSNGYIEVLSDEYGNKGTVYKPGNATYDQMIKNLSAFSSAQKATIAKVIGSDKFVAALSSPPVVTSGGRQATAGELSPPIYHRPWFMPVVGVSAVVLGITLVVTQPWKRFL
jgi:hypothetical protein